MPYRIKVPGKKSPVDETQLMTTMERLWLAAEENRRGIFAGLVVLLLAVAVVAGVIWYDYQQSQQAVQLDEEATTFYTTRPGNQPEQAGKNLKQAITLYGRVVEEFPRSSVAPHSLYRFGIALEEDGRLEEAIRAYEKFVASYGQSQLLLGLVYQRLGYAYLTKGDHDKAENAFQSAVAVPGAMNKDYALFEMAKLQEEQSSPEGALAYYQELVEGYPYSPLVGEATVRMNALGVKEESESDPTQGQQGQDEEPQNPPADSDEPQ
jgi:tetratricopeptide (TPR) repeat protein